MRRIDFEYSAKTLNSISLTDIELLEQLRVHQCLCDYFSIEGGIVYRDMMRRLDMLEGFARARKWRQLEDNSYICDVENLSEYVTGNFESF